MPVSFIIAMAGVGINFVVVLSALMIHGIWLAPFIERHGRRSAGFFALGMLPVGIVRDYLVARQICRERGVRPRWLKWLASLLVATGVSAVLIIAFILSGILLR